MSAGSMQVQVGRTVKVRVPATSANLGPGFDTLGLALGFYDELEVTVTSDSVAHVEVIGEGSADSAAPVATDSTNLVVQSIAHAFSFAGVNLPGLYLVAHNQIPHSRGMGSSSAAIVSGLMAAKGLLEGLCDFDEDTLLRLATELEGHPDNVAPALFGGLTIAWMTNDSPRFKKVKILRDISVILFVPSNSVSTSYVRSLQPESIPIDDAIFNIGRTALLIESLASKSELILESTEDRIHQEYRADAMPETYELVLNLRANGFPAVISGAGPSAIVFCVNKKMKLAVLNFAREKYSNWKILPLKISQKGASFKIARK